METRQFNCPFSGKVDLKDSYNNKRGEYSVSAGVASLPICASGFFYSDSSGLQFRIYRGEGVLSWAHAQKHYDFTNLSAQRIYDCLARRGNGDKLAQDFVSVYDLNISLNSDYLLPPNFESLDKQLCASI